MARAIRRGSTRGIRRKTSWGFGPTSGTSGSAQSFAITGSLLMTTGVTPTLDGITLVRTRGELLMYLSTVTAALDGFHGAFGIGVVPGGNRGFLAVGGGALPIPITNEDDETWIYHRYIALTGATAAVSDSDSLGSTQVRIDIDSKAMRKVNVGDQIYASWEAAETGTAVMQIHFNSRMLFKLS